MMENYLPDFQRKRLIEALTPSPSDPLGKFGAEPPAHWGKGVNEMAKYGFTLPAWGVPVQGWENYRQSQNVEDRRGLGPDGGDNDPRKYEWKQLLLPQKPAMFGDDIEAFIKQNAQDNEYAEPGMTQNGFMPFSPGLFGLGSR